MEFSAGFGRVFSARRPRVTLRQCTRESARRWGASVAVTMPQPAPTRGFMVGVIGRLVVVAGVITRRDLAARCTIFRGLLGVCNPGGTALRPAMGPHDGAGRSLAPPPNLPLVIQVPTSRRDRREEQGAKKLFPGHRSSNRAYLHDVRHHGPQLSEGPTQNRRNGDAKQGFSSQTTRALREPCARSVAKRILSPSGFRIYSPVAFRGCIWRPGGR